jgi:hypothetical protein
MKTIPLSKGKVTLVDDKDYNRVAVLHWYASKEKGLWYARAYCGKSNTLNQTTVRMHRLILGIMNNPNIQVDHRDGDGLNNRRLNLRVATNAQNSMNRRKKIGCLSQYKGVYLDKRYNKWRASIMFNKKRYHLGHYSNEKDAALAYNRKALEFFGEYALLNNVL